MLKMSNVFLDSKAVIHHSQSCVNTDGLDASQYLIHTMRDRDQCFDNYINLSARSGINLSFT